MIPPLHEPHEPPEPPHIEIIRLTLRQFETRLTHARARRAAAWDDVLSAQMRGARGDEARALVALRRAVRDVNAASQGRRRARRALESALLNAAVAAL
jgi:hypothetical protein